MAHEYFTFIGVILSMWHKWVSRHYFCERMFTMNNDKNNAPENRKNNQPENKKNNAPENKKNNQPENRNNNNAR